jgi:AcrR family transcriptional regulator
MSKRAAGTPRIGRPPAAESEGRREQILLAARKRFAAHGYAAATLSGIAGDAGISLAALYHYFTDRAELYEAVFDDTAESTWAQIGKRIEAGADAPHALQALIEAIDTAGHELDEHDTAANMFLATVPIEAGRHPELKHLLERRRRIQERQFRALVAPAFYAGRLPAFDDLDTAVEAVRLLVMGWAVETQYQRSRTTESKRAVMAVLRDFGQRTVPPDPVELTRGKAQ